MDVKIEETWKQVLAPEFQKGYFRDLVDQVKRGYGEKTVYPPARAIFRAFELCPFPSTRVVIVGQDPYHGRNQADGLCFSVPRGVAIPPSLRQIFQEVVSDVGGSFPLHGDLERWANQGVLLLNTTLTVEAGQPASHATLGWERFTDAAIQALAEQRDGLVFILWGSHAQKKRRLISLEQHGPAKHLILTAPHPSPLSAHRGFSGCRHFSKANHFLVAHQQLPIVW